jgi:hypothetical protein
MMDFLEITGSETGKRIMVNMGMVMWVKESGNGKAGIWMPKPREYETITPREDYELIRRRVMNIITGGQA